MISSKSLFFLLIFSLLSFSARAEIVPAEGYPEVVQIFSKVNSDGMSNYAGTCTGTFIRPTLLLTAAHCVRYFNSIQLNGVVIPGDNITAGTKDVYTFRGNQVEYPTRIHVSDLAVPIGRPDMSPGGFEQDLAILEFSHPWPQTRDIGHAPPAPGDSVVTVGFGSHGPWLSRRARPKHQGRNVINPEVGSYGVLETLGSADVCQNPAPHSNDWAVCIGDSGGPLIDSKSGKVLGVASSAEIFKPTSPKFGRMRSTYMDITQGEGAKFVESVIRAAEHR